jgi:hypothetical protein
MATNMERTRNELLMQKTENQTKKGKDENLNQAKENGLKQ